MNKIIKTLNFLRLLDRDNNLSLTNILFYTAIISLLIQPSITGLILAVLGVLSYVHKRQITSKYINDKEELIQEINSLKIQEENFKILESKVMDLQNQINDINMAKSINAAHLDQVQNMVNGLTDPANPGNPATGRFF